MTALPIKLDHGLSKHIKVALQNFGYDIDTAEDEGLATATDEVLATAAQHAGRMLFTVDKRFVDHRRYPAGAHCGIVLFRIKDRTGRVQQAVETFVHTHNLAELFGCLVVVDENNHVRVRRPPTFTDTEHG